MSETSRRQVTNQAELDIALIELRNYRQNLRSWWENRANDLGPNQYGILSVPQNEVDREARRLINQYDYLVYRGFTTGDTGTGELVINVQRFPDVDINKSAQFSNTQSQQRVPNVISADDFLGPIDRSEIDRQSRPFQSTGQEPIFLPPDQQAIDDEGIFTPEPRSIVPSEPGKHPQDPSRLRGLNDEQSVSSTVFNDGSDFVNPGVTETQGQIVDTSIADSLELDREFMVLEESQSTEEPITGANPDDGDDGLRLRGGRSINDTTGQRDPDRGPEELLGSGVDFEGDAITTAGDVRNIPGTTSSQISIDRTFEDQPTEQNNPKMTPRPNVLHNYSNWTYHLSLYMLTKQDFQEINDTGTVQARNRRLLLMKSGGSENRGALNNNKDYFIDNLRFSTIQSQGYLSRYSNSYDISFQITEPYGTSFLAELVALARRLGIDDQYDIPYLLQMDFKGYNDDGTTASIDAAGPKYLPIKIINVTFNIVNSSTVYTITAIPYSHVPLIDDTAKIKETFKLNARTVGEAFDALTQHLNFAEQARAGNIGPVDNQETLDDFEIVVEDNNLASSLIEYDNTVILRNLGFSVSGDDHESITILADTVTKSAIAWIVRASMFGAEQNTVGYEESKRERGPIEHVKVIPVVKRLKEYNNTAKRYARSIAFKVITEKTFGRIFNNAVRSSASDLGWIKEYDWIFTGQNKDILDFNAQYNLQYFQYQTKFLQEKQRLQGLYIDTSTSPQSAEQSRVNSSVDAPRLEDRTQSLGDIQDIRSLSTLAASDIADNIISNPGADLVNITMSIIGDPDWIPQDASILPQGISTPQASNLIIGGSIAIDEYPPQIMVRFRTPRDYNSETGLMSIESNQSFIEGIYRVYKTTSIFENGKFTQELEANRLPDQDSSQGQNADSVEGRTDFDSFEFDESVAPTLDAIGGSSFPNVDRIVTPEFDDLSLNQPFQFQSDEPESDSVMFNQIRQDREELQQNVSDISLEDRR